MSDPYQILTSIFYANKIALRPQKTAGVIITVMLRRPVILTTFSLALINIVLTGIIVHYESFSRLILKSERLPDSKILKDWLDTLSTG